MTELVEYQGFIDRWREEISNPRLKEQYEFINRFNRLRNEYSKLKINVEKTSLIAAPRYNIFKLLRVDRDEVRFSGFLAHLLDPHETHGQGLLFLRTFLEYCSRKYTDFPLPSQVWDKGRWNVITEMGIEEGRLDISALNIEANCLILIENKVDAKEQNNQLARYWQRMEKMHMDFPYQALIFLTVSGYEATSSEGHPYYRLSYHQDIPTWLDPVLNQIQAVGVREVVRQYMEIAHNL